MLPSVRRCSGSARGPPTGHSGGGKLRLSSAGVPLRFRASMGIADLFRPKHRHSDVRVRTEAVRALTADDAATLIQIARTDRDISVRRLAIERIATADVLAEIAAAEPERSLRDLAGERAAQLWVSQACSADPDAAGAALAGMIKLGDQHALVAVAARAEAVAVRK